MKVPLIPTSYPVASSSTQWLWMYLLVKFECSAAGRLIVLTQLNAGITFGLAVQWVGHQIRCLEVVGSTPIGGPSVATPGKLFTRRQFVTKKWHTQDLILAV